MTHKYKNKKNIVPGQYREDPVNYTKIISFIYSLLSIPNNLYTKKQISLSTLSQFSKIILPLKNNVDKAKTINKLYINRI